MNDSFLPEVVKFWILVWSSFLFLGSDNLHCVFLSWLYWDTGSFLSSFSPTSRMCSNLCAQIIFVDCQKTLLWCYSIFIYQWGKAWWWSDRGGCPVDCWSCEISRLPIASWFHPGLNPHCCTFFFGSIWCSCFLVEVYASTWIYWS